MFSKHLMNMDTIRVNANLFCKMVLASMGISEVTDEILEKDNDVVVYSCEVLEQRRIDLKNVASIFSNPRMRGSISKDGCKKMLYMEMQYDLEESDYGVKFLKMEKKAFEKLVGMVVRDLLGIRCNAEMEVKAVDSNVETSIYSAFVTLKYDCKVILDIDKISAEYLNSIGFGMEIVVEDKETLSVNIY